MMRLTRWITDHPIWTLLIFLALTAFFTAQVPKMRVETDLGAALPQNLPVKRLYDEIEKLFPSREVILVALAAENLWEPALIEQVQQLERELYRIRGVWRVVGPTSAQIVQGTPEGLQITKALTGDPRDPQALARMRDRLLQSDFVGLVVSEDERAFGILVQLKAGVRARDVAADVQSLVRRWRAEKDLELYATGRPVIEELLAEGLERDVRVFFTLVLVVIVLILLLSFRTLRGVLLPLAVVIASVLWAMGLMVLLDIPFSHSTEFLPVLLISIGIADGIHILSAYYRLARNHQDKKELVRAVMAELNVPVILTSLTTAVAFLALGAAGFRSLRDLGFTTAMGVLAAMAFSITILPAMLALLPIPKRAPEARLSLLRRGLGAYGRGILARKALTIGLIGLFVLGMLAGLPRIRVENSTIENFPPDSEARRAYSLVAQHLAGPEVLIALVESESPQGVVAPDVLRKLDEFKRAMTVDPAVGGALSLADLIKRLSQALHGGDPAFYVIPDDPALVQQLLALYRFSSEPGELESLLTPDGTKTRVSFFLKDGRRTVIERVEREAQMFIENNFREEKVALTGTPAILRAVNDLVVTGQSRSVVISLLLVMGLVALAFRSAIAGLYGIIPLGFAMLVNFGVMGWLGIYANIENMVTSNIAIGVGVDYMIHFLHRYRREYRSDPTQAGLATLETAGAAILLNALAVAAGFAVIMASTFRSVSQMGFLISLAMLSTCFAALTVLPVLLAWLRPKFLTR